MCIRDSVYSDVKYICRRNLLFVNINITIYLEIRTSGVLERDFNDQMNIV